MAAADLYREPRLFFTSPWDPVVVRRGDALGLRALTDRFADALVPDLSNRIRDGRWVTILAWCLVRSQERYHAIGGRAVLTRAEQANRYAWLRPLELMWVARTIALAKDWTDRPLPGQRRVRKWYEDKQSMERLGMSRDQFRAYRQNGMYGGYRLAFRKWPGMSQLGDGWTPGPATKELAKWLDAKLGPAQPWPLHVDHDEEGYLPKRSIKVAFGNESLWWLRHWRSFDRRSRSFDRNTLPRPRNEFEALPECDLLRPLVFGTDSHGKRRLEVAREAAKSAATKHIQLCEHFASTFKSDPTISLLPRFSRLADAGIAAMDLVSGQLQNHTSTPLVKVASHTSAAPICAELFAAAQDWCKHQEIQLRHIETADRFARSFQSPRPVECLRALLQHHEQYGGALRWFVLVNNRVEPRTPPRAGSSRYRFRLWPLCRLAIQCGVLRNMPKAFRDRSADEPSEEADDE